LQAIDDLNVHHDQELSEYKCNTDRELSELEKLSQKIMESKAEHKETLKNQSEANDEQISTLN
jgi:hypothetical protein